jgi:hypothetical protein
MELVTKIEPLSPYAGIPVEYPRYVYTRQDLENIKLDPSTRLIKPVTDNFPDEFKYNSVFDNPERLRVAFYNYVARASVNNWWEPKLNGWFDVLRYKLHRKLLAWKVII